MCQGIVTKCSRAGKLSDVRNQWYPALKRVVDIAVSSLALVLLSPLFAFVWAMSSWKFGRPIMFTQVRPGKDERPFVMYKFRTMTNAVGPDGELLADELRVTRWGRFLRASSLDELPELINVVKGDMSLVGPRPLLVSYLPHYSKQQRRRHEVRPGITGHAQVNGRNLLDWQTKFALDVEYVDKLSLALDLSILAKTLASVFKREGINTVEGKAMPRFDQQDPDTSTS